VTVSFSTKALLLGFRSKVNIPLMQAMEAHRVARV
jgi:hypothetical protein